MLRRDRLVDQFLALEGWLGEDATRRLVRQLAGREFGEPRAQALGAFLQTRVIPIGCTALQLLRSAVAVIDETNGLVTVKELSATLDVSSSSLYRLCKNYMGVGPKQLCEILFERMKLPVKKKTATGQPSTDEEVLQELAADFPLPKVLLDYEGLLALVPELRAATKEASVHSGWTENGKGH